MMDVELLAGLAPGVATVVWGTAGRSPDPVTTQDDGDHNEPFVAFALQVAKSRCPPAVFSISYTDEEDSATRRYATRFATEMAKAGARGISVLVASGDNGSGGAWRENCHGKFQPSFPSTVPWITAVGGTSVGQSWPGRHAGFTHARYEEVAHAQSSGGFSAFFKRPPYQRRAVAAYLRLNDPTGKRRLPPTSEFHGAGRGYPDVAAMYQTYAIACGGRDVTISGTSASTPVVAAIVSLLNDVRRTTGKPPLGFLNPLLYKHPEALNDVVRGSNEGCDGMGGFPAARGWDAVSGLGSPSFKKLKAVILGLP